MTDRTYQLIKRLRRDGEHQLADAVQAFATKAARAATEERITT
jgi:hypothetical protein